MNKPKYKPIPLIEVLLTDVDQEPEEERHILEPDPNNPSILDHYL